MVLTVVLEAGQGLGMMNVARDAVQGSPDALLPVPAAIDCRPHQPTASTIAMVNVACVVTVLNAVLISADCGF